MIEMAPWFAAGGKPAWGCRNCQSRMRGLKKKDDRGNAPPAESAEFDKKADRHTGEGQCRQNADDDFQIESRRPGFGGFAIHPFIPGPL
jgi:hypothetical protein